MDPNVASSSYRPRGYGISPALKRAREPYKIRNAVTGGLLVAFAASVWAYSMSAVRQDNFDDIDAVALDNRQHAAAKEDETSPLASPSSSPIIIKELVTKTEAVISQPPSSSTPKPKSILSILGHFRPTILDAFTSQPRSSDGRIIVWGAPPLNRLGSVGDRTTEPWKKV